MAGIGKLVKIGLKKLEATPENAKAIRNIAAKRYNEMKKEGMPEAVLLKAKKQLREAEANMKSSSSIPRTTFGGKKKRMATKKDKPLKRKIKAEGIKQDYSSQELLKAGKK